MDRQTDRWTEGRPRRFPLALGGSSAQTRATPVRLSLRHSPFLWQKSESPTDRLAPCSPWLPLLPGCSCPFISRIVHTKRTFTHRNPYPLRRPSLQKPGDSSKDQTGGGGRAGTRTPPPCQRLCASWHAVNRRAPSLQSARMKITGLHTCSSSCTREDLSSPHAKPLSKLCL